MHSVRIEPVILIEVGTRITYQATEDAMGEYERTMREHCECTVQYAYSTMKTNLNASACTITVWTHNGGPANVMTKA